MASCCCCRWSHVLTPGPAFLRTSITKGIRHTLWENHKWLRQRQSNEQTSDSGDDDAEQFGIREGVEDGGEQAAADGEDEEDVLPLYGEADSDFGDSSSEVTSMWAASCVGSTAAVTCNNAVSFAVSWEYQT